MMTAWRYLMRYLAVVACSLSVLLAACTLDDGPDAKGKSTTAVAGQDLVLDIGTARLMIDGAAIGTTAGQLPPGTRVTLEVAKNKPAGYDLYSPVFKVSAKDEDGDAITGLTLNPPAVLDLSYDKGHADEDGVSNAELTLLSIDATGVDELTFTSLAPAADTQFVIPAPRRVQGVFTSLNTYAVTRHKDFEPPPPATALTGSTSTLATSTIFQLADSMTVFSVTMAIPTADTTTPPTVITLNDAAFNDGNPLDPNNRLLTMQTGGKNYTSNHANASVVAQLDTFSGAGSSGSMLGTLIEQGASAALQINFTFTTGAGSAVTLGGAVTDAGGRRTILLTNAGGTETLLMMMPDTLPDVGLAPITFDNTTFDSAMPLAPTSRLLTVDDGTRFTSDLATASVTVTFTSFNATTFTGAGTITGTAANTSPATKTLNYTFNIVAGSDGGSGSVSLDTAFDITTTDVADECAVATDGTDYIVAWLSDVGVTNRTIEYIFLDGTTLTPSGPQSYEPTVSLNPAGGFALASNDIADTVAVGADGSNPATATAWAIFYDPVFGSLYSEVSLGTGAQPRVQYHFDQDVYVIAWQSGTNVMAGVFEFDGTQVGTSVTVFTAATLTGIAAAGDTTNEVLITANDSTGIRGRFVVPGTGALAAGAFDISTSLGGGACSWEDAGGNYIVMTEALIGGFFAVRQAVVVTTGGTGVTGSPLALPLFSGLTKGDWGSDAAMFTNTSAALLALDSSASGPALVAAPIYGDLQGGLNVDLTANGAAIGSLGGTGYVLVSALGAGGVHVQPLTLTP
jgi:hypothetical protein